MRHVCLSGSEFIKSVIASPWTRIDYHQNLLLNNIIHFSNSYLEILKILIQGQQQVFNVGEMISLLLLHLPDLGSVHPLQDVALRITSPVVSLSGISAPSDSFHLHDVVSPSLHLSTS